MAQAPVEEKKDNNQNKEKNQNNNHNQNKQKRKKKVKYDRWLLCNDTCWYDITCKTIIVIVDVDVGIKHYYFYGTDNDLKNNIVFSSKDDMNSKVTAIGKRLEEGTDTETYDLWKIKRFGKTQIVSIQDIEESQHYTILKCHRLKEGWKGGEPYQFTKMKQNCKIVLGSTDTVCMLIKQDRQNKILQLSDSFVCLLLLFLEVFF